MLQNSAQHQAFFLHSGCRKNLLNEALIKATAAILFIGKSIQGLTSDSGAFCFETDTNPLKIHTV
ncbi:hypothetical protein CHISP_3130 [Chitinispirillum alkaliphilum]|nr:hypothetical protein CHISP_3130 [Chitinispirillum alkaliphilum]